MKITKTMITTTITTIQKHTETTKTTKTAIEKLTNSLPRHKSRLAQNHNKNCPHFPSPSALRPHTKMHFSLGARTSGVAIVVVVDFSALIRCTTN